MHKIEKSILFTELTVEQSASVSGGNGTDLLQDLVDRLKALGPNVNVVTNSGSVSNNPGSTPTASAGASGPLRGLEVVSGGNIKVRDL